MSTRIELTEEQIDISKREVTTGVFRASVKTVASEEQAVFTLDHAAVEVVRVPFDKVVDAIPTVTTEGDLTIVPVFEERLVKQIVLTEEIHIRRVVKRTQINQPTTLRRQVVEIERAAPGVPEDRD